jgi:hypothetical protein
MDILIPLFWIALIAMFMGLALYQSRHRGDG